MKHIILGLFRNWIFFTSLYLKHKMTFRKLDFSPSSGQRVKSVVLKWALWKSPMTITRMVPDPCFVVDPNKHCMSPYPTVRLRKTDQISETLCCSW